MKKLIIDTISQEIRTFKDATQNWETQNFEELQLEENENFATQIEEIQETLNEHNEYEVLVIVECFGRIFKIELFENTIQCKGLELFNPKTKECFFKGKNKELLFNCISKDWVTTGLEVKGIIIPDEISKNEVVYGYEYALVRGDYDIYCIYNLSERQ